MQGINARADGMQGIYASDEPKGFLFEEYPWEYGSLFPETFLRNPPVFHNPVQSRLVNRIMRDKITLIQTLHILLKDKFALNFLSMVGL